MELTTQSDSWTKLIQPQHDLEKLSHFYI